MPIDQSQVNSYQEKLLEAMQLISSQLISSIPYDKTIVCTIVDATCGKEGKYKVSYNNGAPFDAYSSDVSLKEKESVYVTIPEGNFENQKIIQGKKTSETEKPFIFTTPFDTLLDVTDNLISDEINTKKGLIANNNYTTSLIEIEQDNEIVKQEVVNTMQAQFIEICNLDVSDLKLTGYSRLGIKADFMTWLNNVNRGSYGLRITITDNLNTTTTNEHTVSSVQQTKTMLLDVSDMYGNPYKFENYYNQEKVFPITELNTITNIKIEFYQIAGSFYDDNNNILTLQESSIIEDGLNKTYTSDFGENLFVDNVYICLGYDTSEITNELIVPVVDSSMTYSAYREAELNKKEIDLRWVHQFDDGPLVVEPERDFDIDNENATLKDCEIRWYRYRLGAAAADEYCGVYWTGLTVTKSDNGKYILSEWDGRTITEEKTDIDGNIMHDKDGNKIMITRPEYGEKQALEGVIFTPNTEYQTEQIKAIIYLNGIAIRGPIITFTNEEATVGKEVSNFINALEIECLDEAQGNYFIYNEAGNLLLASEAAVERTLKCNFAKEGEIAKSDLNLNYEQGDSISWKFPIHNSMISLQRCGGLAEKLYEIVSLTQDTYNAGEYYIKNKETNQYELSNEYIEEETYYKQVQSEDNIIDLAKVWVKINDFNFVENKENEVPFKLMIKYYSDDTLYEWNKNEEQDEEKTIEYYALWYEGIEYYRNTQVKETSEGKPQAPYYDTYYEPWNIYKDRYERNLILQNKRTLKYEPFNHTTTILYPSYKINTFCSMHNMNNTITCTIRKERNTYTTEKKMNFGVAGTMGTDKTIIVGFVGGHTAIDINNQNDIQYALEVKMYDENNKPQNLNDVSITWSWYRPGDDNKEGKTNKNIKFQGESNDGKVQTKNTATIPLIITKESGKLKLDINDPKDIYIAQVTVGASGAELTTYFPIPLKYSSEYSYIEGATSVIYLSNGEPDYYKGNYNLYKTIIRETDGIPEVNLVSKTEWKTISIDQETDADGKSKISRYIANIKQTTGTDDKAKTYKLQPINVYTSGVSNYAVVASVKSDGETMIPVWQQPILVIRNNYPNRVINKWDGKTLELNNGNGTILSTALAAGMKDGNKFTGVMVGDWSTSGDSSISQTGVFGFHQGAMCYAFQDNGNAFIGKNGKGRITFNGDKGEISGGYDSNGKNPNMIIDLANGQINAETFSLRAGSRDEYVVLQTSTGGRGSYSEDNPLQIGKYFDVSWKGHVNARSAQIGAWNVLPMDNTTTDGISAGSIYSDITTTGQYQDPIILDPVLNTVTGGKFIASILEAKDEDIKLGGYIEVYPVPVSTATSQSINYSVAGTGKLGYITSSFGEGSGEGDGIGMEVEASGQSGDYAYSCVKATAKNTGMSYNGSYFSMSTNSTTLYYPAESGGTASKMEFSKNGINMSNTSGGRLIADEKHIGIGYDKDNYITLYDNTCNIAHKYNIQLNINAKQYLFLGTVPTNTPTIPIFNIDEDQAIANKLLTANSGITITTTGLLVESGSITIGADAIDSSKALYAKGAIQATEDIEAGGNIKTTDGNIIVDAGQITASGDISTGASIMVKDSIFVGVDGTSSKASISSSGDITVSGTVTFDPTKTQTGIRAQFA